MRHEKHLANGAYNDSEYDSVRDPAQLKAILACAPLQNVRLKTAYPAVLITTAPNDPRVTPWQSRKLTAGLQLSSTSNQPPMLLTRMNAGHGAGAPRCAGNTAIMPTFVAQRWGWVITRCSDGVLLASMAWNATR